MGSINKKLFKSPDTIMIKKSLTLSYKSQNSMLSLAKRASSSLIPKPEKNFSTVVTSDYQNPLETAFEQTSDLISQRFSDLTENFQATR